MPFIRHCKDFFFGGGGGYFGHIPKQTNLKPWYKYRVHSKICMHPKNPDNRTYYYWKITDLLCCVLWACSGTLT